jgi:DNA-binding NarL/FixJ family response regulator
MKTGIEFFATGDDVFMIDQEGQLKPFDRFPLEVLDRLREEIEADAKLEQALDELTSGTDQIRQFIRCRFGAFNNQGDLVDGVLTAEYIDCGHRSDCMYEGIICRRELTSRELEILKLIADDLADKQIADKLGISVFTVSNHRASILHKLGIASKIGLARFACLNQLNH